MSDHDKDDMEALESIPIYDRVTSKFEWRKRPPARPQQGFKTYDFKVEGGMGFIVNGIRVGNPKN